MSPSTRLGVVLAVVLVAGLVAVERGRRRRVGVGAHAVDAPVHMAVGDAAPETPIPDETATPA